MDQTPSHDLELTMTNLQHLDQCFKYRLSAFEYFFEQLQHIYEPMKLPIGDGVFGPPRELAYYLDATIFELHAASQIHLHLIASIAKINLAPHETQWNSRFKNALSATDKKLLGWLENYKLSPEIYLLDSYRNHIAHNGDTTFAYTSFNGRIKEIVLDKRHMGDYSIKTDKSIELIQEIIRVSKYLRDSHTQLLKWNQGR